MRVEKDTSITDYTYDSGKNYVTSVEDPIGNSVSYEYDALGNKTSYTDGKGNSTSYQYDQRNLLTKVIDVNLDETLYNYDAAGNLTTVTDAKNNQTTYDYNEFNLLSSITNPLDQTIDFEYDKNGNATEVIFPKGNQISYEYNGLNRLASIYYNSAKKWDFAYDRNGNLTSVTDNDTAEITTYSYDKNNRLTSQQEGSTNSIDYSYDNNGNITDLKITADTVSKYYKNNYNDFGQLIRVGEGYVELNDFAYDDRGNLASINRDNSSYTVFEYDDANRLTAVRNYDDSGELLDKYEYSYDANSNWTNITTTEGTISYQYDNLNRLIQETLLDGTTISYEYDKVGNRTKKIVDDGTVTTTNYSYDAANQLTAVDGQTYSYDQNGNLTDNGEKSFIYNAKNRLIEVKDSSNQTLASFTYDQKGRRKSKTTASGTTYYHYDINDRLIYETDGNNDIVTQYFYDANGNLVNIIKDGVTYYYHLNGHGDVTTLTDSDGNVVAEYKYDAWGNIISQTGTMASENPYRYAGYRYDEETGLYYLNARYYDAEIGRFITGDVVQTLNLYSYAEGNPVRFIDSSGHFIWDVLDIFSLAYSAKDFWNNPGLLTGAFLIWDIAALLPAVPGSYVADGANALDKGMDLQLFARNADDVFVKPLGRGSTGRIIPNSLKEQLAMKEVLADPLTNATDLSNYVKMTDSRWSVKEGWVKMSKNVNDIEIHYVYNKITGAFDDFKFK